MVPDVAFEDLGPLDQFYSVSRLIYPWSTVYEWYMDRSNRDLFHAVESYWFRSVGKPTAYRTLLDDLVFKPGIDRDAAIRHLGHVIGSTLKHEWKIGGAAMLIKEWCEPLDFEAYDREDK